MAFALPLTLLLVFHVDDFELYVVGQVLAQGIALAWCLYKAKDVLGSGLLPPRASVELAIKSVRVGIKLMVSNIASMLILGILRFAVDANWGIETFGQLSLSLSLISFVVTFASQVGMVLFPALRRAQYDELKDVLYYMRDFMALTMPSLYLLVPPAVCLLSLWLPAYAEGLRYLVWLFPICIFDAQMSILGTTYLKVLRGEAVLLRLNLVTMAISTMGVLISIGLFGSFESAVGIVILSIASRSIAGEWSVYKLMGLEHSMALSIGEVAISVVYCVVNLLSSGFAAFFGYLIVYTTFLLVFCQAAQDGIEKGCSSARETLMCHVG